MTVLEAFAAERQPTKRWCGGYPKAFTSGKLFVSADGREMIASFDEPPAAPGKVLAAWRRLLIEPGTVPPEETLAALKAKYGLPTGSPAMPVGAPADFVVMRGGSPINWSTPRGQRCTGFFGSGSMRPLSEFWTARRSPSRAPGLGKDRNPRHNRHSMASAKGPSPPFSDDRDTLGDGAPSQRYIRRSILATRLV